MRRRGRFVLWASFIAVPPDTRPPTPCPVLPITTKSACCSSAALITLPTGSPTSRRVRRVIDGERVAATVHRIANGPPLFGFSATVRTVAPDKVDPEVLNELLTHVALGPTLSEVQHSLDDQRQRRRVVELVA